MKKKPRLVEIDVAVDDAQQLARAVQAYAHAAFPPGGSECAQVSREALLDTARLCEQHPGGTLALNKRQLPQLRAAVSWYFTEVDPGSAVVGEALGARLARSSATATGPVQASG